MTYTEISITFESLIACLSLCGIAIVAIILLQVSQGDCLLTNQYHLKRSSGSIYLLQPLPSIEEVALLSDTEVAFLNIQLENILHSWICTSVPTSSAKARLVLNIRKIVTLKAHGILVHTPEQLSFNY